MEQVMVRERWRPDPSVRMLCGVILCAAALVIEPSHADAIPRLLAIALGALVLHGGRILRLLGLIAAGTALYVPVILLGSPAVACKGLAIALTMTSPASGLSPREASTVILRLPLPRFTKLLLEQMLHQAGILMHETRNVFRALTVRGGMQGVRGLLTFGRTIPLVWLPRVAHRAERVAVAMDLRGYSRRTPHAPPVRWTRAEWVYLSAALLVTICIVRCGWPGGM